jgi:hypothetical protein
VVEGDGLRRLDRPRRSGAVLALYLATPPTGGPEVYPADDLRVGHWRERAGPEEGYTLKGIMTRCQ